LLRRLLAVAAATVTIAVTTHAGLGWLALWAVTVCAVAIKPNSKVQSNEARLGKLVAVQGAVNATQSAATTAVNTRVGNLSGQATGTGLPGGTPTGGPNGTGFFNTQGLASGSYGSTHQHTLPDFPTATHTHDFDGHTHDLPTV
jgi:hypothetical protein